MNGCYNREEAGKRLRKKRKELRVTAGKVAEMIGRAPNYYRDIERGTCGMSIETLIQLADCMELSTDYIIFGNAESTGEMTQAEAAYRSLTGYDLEVQKNAVKLMKTFLRMTGMECSREA